MILYDFKNASGPCLPGIRTRMLSAKLCHAQSDADFILHGLGKLAEGSSLAEPTRTAAFRLERVLLALSVIPVLEYYVYT